MKILVTGGCGFIGTNFIRHIIEKYPDYEIVNLDKLTYAGNSRNFDDLEEIEDDEIYSFFKGDICDKALVEEITEDIDLIVNFAAESHVDRSIENSEDFIKTNINGTLVLLEAARKKNIRFHHVSTDEVFGSLGPEGLFDENTPYDPRSPYSASKAASDHLVRSYFHTHGLAVTISNCSNNYGPFQHPEKLIPLFITNLMEKIKIPVYGDGSNIRDWLHVKDHCEAIDVIIHEGKSGETYCIGGNSEKTNMEITKLIIKDFSRNESAIEYVKDRKGHDKRYAIDATKIRNELGWVPKYTFEQGLKETIEWYLKNRTWWQKLKEKKEFQDFENKKFEE